MSSSANGSGPQDEVVIAERFRGPPRSGNGGYVAGVGASLLDTSAPVEVTLRAPVPLDTPMRVVRDGGSVITVMDGDTLVLEVREEELDLEIPIPPSWEKALAARDDSPSFMKRGMGPANLGVGFHPICFCCGASHDEGLQVFAGPVDGGEQVAAAWTTRSEWGDRDGNLPEAYLWTALDCPGQFAFLAGEILTGMLGRMTGRVVAPARAGEEYLVTGWRVGVEGKKHYAGTAIHDRGGNLVAMAKAVWIGRRELPPG